MHVTLPIQSSWRLESNFANEVYPDQGLLYLFMRDPKINISFEQTYRSCVIHFDIIANRYMYSFKCFIHVKLLSSGYWLGYYIHTPMKAVKHVLNPFNFSRVYVCLKSSQKITTMKQILNDLFSSQHSKIVSVRNFVSSRNKSKFSGHMVDFGPIRKAEMKWKSTALIRYPNFVCIFRA